MLQARNAMLAADQMRFGGANQDVFASTVVENARLARPEVDAAGALGEE